MSRINLPQAFRSPFFQKGFLVFALLVAGFLSFLIPRLNETTYKPIIPQVHACGAYTWITNSCGSGCSDAEYLNRPGCNAGGGGSGPVKCDGFADPGTTHRNSTDGCSYTCNSTGNWSTGFNCPAGTNPIHAGEGPPDAVPPAGDGTGTTASPKCSNAYPTAGVCLGADVGRIIQNALGAGRHVVCTRTTNDWCSALPIASSTSQDVDGDGIVDGSIQPGNLAGGGCPYVITCNCGGTVKQHCSYNNTWGADNVGQHCQQDVCPAVNPAAGKVCEPGSVKCTTGTSGQLCNGNGTGFMEEEVRAHACGSTSGLELQWCHQYQRVRSGAASNLDIPIDYQCYQTKQECEAVVLPLGAGNFCVQPDGGNYNAATDSNITASSCAVGQYFRRFTGCGDISTLGGKKNCYNICDSGTVRNNVCVDEPGLSCGATNASVTPVSPAPSLPPGQTPPPEETPPPPSSPQPSPEPTPQPGQCVQITRSVAAPRIGDQVTFSCAPVNLANRYEFRYAYTTSSQVTESQYLPLEPASVSSLTSVPITIDKVGRYVAMCRPCFGNNRDVSGTCETWDVADLQEIVRDENAGTQNNASQNNATQNNATQNNDEATNGTQNNSTQSNSDRTSSNR